MAKISKQQIENINNQCKNGFLFCITDFIELGEKRLTKDIIIKENQKIVTAKLYWKDEIKYRKNKYGNNIPFFTGDYIPQLYVSIWEKKESESLWRLSTPSNMHLFPDHSSSKKQINKLCQVTALISGQLIRSLLPENERENCMSE